MENSDELFDFVSDKLELHDLSLLQKAKELYRILQSKGTSTKLNDLAKIVMCFDMAASLLYCYFDKENAIKLSGLRKSLYRNSYHNIQMWLDLAKDVTISEVCVQLSCTAIKEVAELIWKKYRESQPALVHNSSTHPLYITVSVCVACKIKKVKVDRAMLVTMSRSTATQFKGLESTLFEFAANLGLGTDQRKRKTMNKELQIVEEVVNTIDVLTINEATNVSNEQECIEDYQMWKKRILNAAYAALKRDAAL